MHCKQGCVLSIFAERHTWLFSGGNLAILGTCGVLPETVALSATSLNTSGNGHQLYFVAYVKSDRWQALSCFSHQTPSVKWRFVRVTCQKQNGTVKQISKIEKQKNRNIYATETISTNNWHLRPSSYWGGKVIPGQELEATKDLIRLKTDGYEQNNFRSNGFKAQISLISGMYSGNSKIEDLKKCTTWWKYEHLLRRKTAMKLVDS